MENTGRGENPEILETAGETTAEEGQHERKPDEKGRRKKRAGKNRGGLKALLLVPVSYTHLTLPTIGG